MRYSPPALYIHFFHNKMTYDYLAIISHKNATALITLAPLQRVQNAAARLVFELRGCEHVTPSLIQLHWLPVRWRIYFKLCTIMHAVHTGNCPAYLQETVHTVSSTTARPGLRSAVSTDYVRSSANAPSPTPVQSRGILFQYTSEKRWTSIVLKDFSRLTLLV